MIEGIWQRANELRNQNREALGSPSRLARFLCGIGSPKLTRAKLTKNPLFGAFEKVPYQDVLNRADQL